MTYELYKHCEHGGGDGGGGGVGAEQMCRLGFDAGGSQKMPLAPKST